LLCGYPALVGGDVFLEVFSPKTGITPVRFRFDENPENWRLQELSLSAYPDATKFRLVAVDNSQKMQGWLGFSPPFTLQKPLFKGLSRLWRQFMLVILCAACSLTCLLGPGIVLRSYLPRLNSAVWLPLPGLVASALLGLFAWLGPDRYSPHKISRWGLALVVLLVGYSLLRRPLTTLLSRAELKILAFILLLIGIAVAKSSYSIGPSGELYKGSISRTLEVGGNSDSRISYHVVQLVGLRQDAYGPLAETLFGVFSFSHRGPIAALAASPIVLSSRPNLPSSLPDTRWTLFDPQGFASYRIAMIVIAASSLFIVFGLAKLFLEDDWAILAFLCIAAAPFTIHELFFTWPKLLAASCVLLGVYNVLLRRFFWGGFAVGFGYLCHPSTLLFFPAVLAITFIGVDSKAASPRAKLLRHSSFALLTCAGLAVWLLFWWWLNRSHFHQDSFLAYFKYSGRYPFTPFNWILSRLSSVAMTLVPFYSFIFHRLDVEALPPDHLSQPWVQFAHQYWATLPCAVGLLFYLPLLRLAVIGFSQAKAWMWLVIVQSFVFFVCYFGFPNTGLLREGLHTWFLGLMLFAVVMWRRHLAHSRAFWNFAAIALAFRGLEVLFVLVPFNSWSRGYALQPPYALSDFCSLVVLFAGAAALSWCAALQCYSMGRTKPVESPPAARQPGIERAARLASLHGPILRWAASVPARSSFFALYLSPAGTGLCANSKTLFALPVGQPRLPPGICGSRRRLAGKARRNAVR